MTPGQAAAEHYDQVYEHFAESAQLYAGTSLASTVMDTATMFLLAADAERKDPAPAPDPIVLFGCCRMCAWYMTLPNLSKPASPLS